MFYYLYCVYLFLKVGKDFWLVYGFIKVGKDFYVVFLDFFYLFLSWIGYLEVEYCWLNVV